SDQDPFPPVNARRRIPDLGDVTRRPGNAAVDRLVQLPEPSLSLKGDLDRGNLADRLDRGTRHRREISRDRAQHRRWYGDHNKRGLGEVFAPAIPPDHPRAVTRAAKCADLSTVGDDGAKLAAERLTDATHATNRLHHRR